MATPGFNPGSTEQFIGEFAVTAPSNLSQHLTLALNLRGIGVYDPEEPPDRPFFTWLARKHQYRNIGFVPSLMEHPTVDVGDYQTFEPAEFPFEAPFTSKGDNSPPRWVMESLIAASAYVSPLFIHEDALAAFEPASCWQLKSDPDLPEDQILRHIRIAGYGMLDCFVEATERGAEVVHTRSIAKERQRREELAAEDGADRFWRLLEEESGNTWIGGYFDPLLVLEADELASRLDANPDSVVGLGLVGGLAINPPYD